MNASGCGVQVKEYGYLLARDPKYAAKARQISAMTKDLAEILPAFAAELQTKSGRHQMAGRLFRRAPATRTADSRRRRESACLLGAEVAVRGKPHVLRLGRDLLGVAARTRQSATRSRSVIFNRPNLM